MKWDLVKCWLTMHSLILSYTKMSGLSNDRSYYLTLLDHVLFGGKIWAFLLRKKRKNPLCFSCDNIKHTYKYVVKIINNHFLWIEQTYYMYENENHHCSSVDKIDTRQFVYNRTFVGGTFSMCYWSTCLLIQLKQLFLMVGN